MYYRNEPRAFQSLLSLALLAVVLMSASCAKTDQPSNSSTGTPAPAARSAGDFEGTIAMKIETENQKEARMTYFLKGKQTRIETKMTDSPEGQAVMLFDLEGGKMTTLMPSRKMYMTVDTKAAAESMKEAAKEMKKSGGEEPTEFPKLTPTGRQETIAGYSCEHWLMGEKQDLDMCVAKGLGYFGMGGQGRGGLGLLKDFAFSPKLLAAAAAHPEWVKFLEGGAFPLKITSTHEGQVKMNMEATRIERKPLEDSLFVIPADYKELSMPTMPGLPARGKQ